MPLKDPGTHKTKLLHDNFHYLFDFMMQGGCNEYPWPWLGYKIGKGWGADADFVNLNSYLSSQIKFSSILIFQILCMFISRQCISVYEDTIKKKNKSINHVMNCFLRIVPMIGEWQSNAGQLQQLSEPLWLSWPWEAQSLSLWPILLQNSDLVTNKYNFKSGPRMTFYFQPSFIFQSLSRRKWDEQTLKRITPTITDTLTLIWNVIWGYFICCLMIYLILITINEHSTDEGVKT